MSATNRVFKSGFFQSSPTIEFYYEIDDSVPVLEDRMVDIALCNNCFL